MDEETWLFRFVLLNKYSTITCRMYTVCHKLRTLNVNSRQLDLMWFAPGFHLSPLRHDWEQQREDLSMSKIAKLLKTTMLIMLSSRRSQWLILNIVIFSLEEFFLNGIRMCDPKWSQIHCHSCTVKNDPESVFWLLWKVEQVSSLTYDWGPLDL